MVKSDRRGLILTKPLKKSKLIRSYNQQVSSLNSQHPSSLHKRFFSVKSLQRQPTFLAWLALGPVGARVLPVALEVAPE